MAHTINGKHNGAQAQDFACWTSRRDVNHHWDRAVFDLRLLLLPLVLPLLLLLLCAAIFVQDAAQVDHEHGEAKAPRAPSLDPGDLRLPRLVPAVYSMMGLWSSHVFSRHMINAIHRVSGAKQS